MTLKKSNVNKSYRRGLWAESLGALLLRLKGYRVLATRAKTPVGEIDIIAKRGNVLVAVEVKARQSLEIAAYSISSTQKKRIVRALEFWCQHHQKYRAIDKRFDVVLVAPWTLPKHIPNAW